MRRFFFLLPLLLFAALTVAFWLALKGGDPRELPSALIDKPVPAFALAGIEGTAIPGLSSADLAQGTPSVVNVFASWCAPCRIEHPLLTRLKERGVTVYGIDYKDKPQAAREFLDELGNPFAKIGADLDGRVGIDWGVYGVPETFVVDGRGVIVLKHVGPLDAAAIEREILPALERASR